MEVGTGNRPVFEMKKRRWWKGFTCPYCARDFMQPVFLAQDESRTCDECQFELMIEADMEKQAAETAKEENSAQTQ